MSHEASTKAFDSFLGSPGETRSIIDFPGIPFSLNQLLVPVYLGLSLTVMDSEYSPSQRKRSKQGIPPEKVISFFPGKTIDIN